MRRDIKHAINTTSPDYGFMKLIRRGDNPNKETSSIYHLSHITMI